MNEDFREFIEQIAELKTQVKYGFDGVHQRLDRLNGSVAKHEEKIHNLQRATDKTTDAVNQDEFWPVKTIVYSFTGLILITVVGALIALVVKTS